MDRHDQQHDTGKGRPGIDVPEIPRKNIEPADAPFPPAPTSPEPEEHEGGTEEQIGDTRGPGVGYDDEPEQEKDRGGVS